MRKRVLRPIKPSEGSEDMLDAALGQSDSMSDALEQKREERAEKKVNGAIFASFYTGDAKTTVEALQKAGFKCSLPTFYRYRCKPSFADDIQKCIQQHNGVLDAVGIKRMLSETASTTDDEHVRLRALELLGKTQALFIERQQNEGEVILSVRQLMHKKKPQTDAAGAVNTAK